MVCSAKKESASLNTGSTNEVSSYDEDEELRTEEQMDRSRRDGRPEESGGADRLQTVDRMDRSVVHGRPSERQNDGSLRDDQTVDLVDRSDIHGRPSARQNGVSFGDDQTVDHDVEDGRPSPRQKVSNLEQLQTVDPVVRSTDGGRSSSSQQAVENLGRGQREKRPNVRLADYVTHVAGSHVGEKCKYPLASPLQLDFWYDSTSSNVKGKIPTFPSHKVSPVSPNLGLPTAATNMIFGMNFFDCDVLCPVCTVAGAVRCERFAAERRPKLGS
ncbi:unnamed protein product [Cuscuta campestris]|uniref:Uncharacterized protein n=1 Tax=Cuscuta campestris TaxID=132261 RepID=A0A484KXF7_9ASTE|nr:unnamed protein product [Cuscuta campestris]